MGGSYVRDGRAPLPLKESTSRVMSANKGKATRPELALRRVLRKNGIDGFRTNWEEAPGRPDIAFPSRRVAIFLNGCFWHRCPYCNPDLPRTHKAFWKRKFLQNTRRDKAKRRALKQAGWQVLTVWECQLRKSPQRAADRVKALVPERWRLAR